MQHQPALCATQTIAERYGVTAKTIREWVKAGRITAAIITPGGHMRFDPAVVAQQLSAGRPLTARPTHYYLAQLAVAELDATAIAEAAE